jgi:hypothetical protein
LNARFGKMRFAEACSDDWQQVFNQNPILDQPKLGD